MDLIILSRYFTLYHLFIQDISSTHKSIWDLLGFLQIAVYLYNKLLGNTYVKSLPHLRYFDSIFDYEMIKNIFQEWNRVRRGYQTKMNKIS